MKHLILLAILFSCGDGDRDNDGFPDELDCAPTDPAVHPDADELCNGVDDDCDGAVDNNPVDPKIVFADVDGDEFGGGTGWLACDVGPAETTKGGDCEDTRDDIYPGAEEVCGDGVDNDCVEGAPPCDLEGVIDLRGAVEFTRTGTRFQVCTHGYQMDDDGIPDAHCGEAWAPGPLIGGVMRPRLYPFATSETSQELGDFTGDGIDDLLWTDGETMRLYAGPMTAEPSVSQEWSLPSAAGTVQILQAGPGSVTEGRPMFVRYQEDGVIQGLTPPLPKGGGPLVGVPWQAALEGNAYASSTGDLDGDGMADVRLTLWDDSQIRLAWLPGAEGNYAHGDLQAIVGYNRTNYIIYNVLHECCGAGWPYLLMDRNARTYTLWMMSRDDHIQIMDVHRTPQFSRIISGDINNDGVMDLLFYYGLYGPDDPIAKAWFGPINAVITRDADLTIVASRSTLDTFPTGTVNAQIVDVDADGRSEILFRADGINFLFRGTNP